MLTLGPEQRGPAIPLAGAPARRPGSVRRTSTIDTTWPDGFLGPMAVRGLARDLRTTDGVADAVSCELRATVARDRTVARIDGSDPRLGALVGTSTLRRFRSAVADALPDLEGTGSPLRLLLDDLPGALLVSGVAVLTADGDDSMSDGRHLEHQVGVCAGWVDDGALLTAAREHRAVPTPATIPCPPLEHDDDALGWHDAPLPEPVATRRRRLLDVSVGDDGALLIEALFRDTHLGEDGVERAFHEYAVHATADRATGTLTAVEAEAGVLPWRECPNALASAGTLVGTSLADLRPQVRTSFRGTSTCTHLNDVLAAIGDASVLASRLPR